MATCNERAILMHSGIAPGLAAAQCLPPGALHRVQAMAHMPGSDHGPAPVQGTTVWQASLNTILCHINACCGSLKTLVAFLLRMRVLMTFLDNERVVAQGQRWLKKDFDEAESLPHAQTSQQSQS